MPNDTEISETLDTLTNIDAFTVGFDYLEISNYPNIINQRYGCNLAKNELQVIAFYNLLTYHAQNQTSY